MILHSKHATYRFWWFYQLPTDFCLWAFLMCKGMTHQAQQQRLTCSKYPQLPSNEAKYGCWSHLCHSKKILLSFCFWTKKVPDLCCFPPQTVAWLVGTIREVKLLPLLFFLNLQNHKPKRPSIFTPSMPKRVYSCNGKNSRLIHTFLMLISWIPSAFTLLYQIY